MQIDRIIWQNMYLRGRRTVIKKNGSIKKRGFIILSHKSTPSLLMSL